MADVELLDDDGEARPDPSRRLPVAPVAGSGKGGRLALALVLLAVGYGLFSHFQAGRAPLAPDPSMTVTVIETGPESTAEEAEPLDYVRENLVLRLDRTVKGEHLACTVHNRGEQEVTRLTVEVQGSRQWSAKAGEPLQTLRLPVSGGPFPAGQERPAFIRFPHGIQNLVGGVTIVVAAF